MKNKIPAYRSIKTLIARGMFSILAFASLLTFISLVALSLSLTDASSINRAGALRMQSVQLAYYLSNGTDAATRHDAVEQFDQSFNHIADNIVDNWDITRQLKEHFLDVKKSWDIQYKILEGDHPEKFLDNVEPFVAEIDLFVQALQHHSEYKVKVITLIKGLGIGLIFTVCIVTLRLIQLQILSPLQQIFEASGRIRKGDFNVSFKKIHENEIGFLANTITHMAQDLDKLYTQLEKEVDAKTIQLKLANDKIDFLYTTSQTLHVSNLNTEMVEQTLTHFAALNGLTFYHLNLTGSEAKPITLESGAHHEQDVVNFPIELESEHFGRLSVLVNELQDMQHIQNYCHIIARAQHRSQANLESQRTLLMEERAVIARELHDSLAQALSYLKIQVVLLKRHLSKQEVTDATLATVEEIDTNLKQSYVQLRELLNTFRLTLDDADLSEAISVMLAQLRQRTSSKIHYNYSLESHLFKPNEHIHVLQIIREAVLNSIKHANSHEIMVDCGTSKNGTIEVSISDDGDGIPTNPEKTSHYGLNIMDERASKLGAKLEIKNNKTNGTMVLLTFNRENKHA